MNFKINSKKLHTNVFDDDTDNMNKFKNKSNVNLLEKSKLTSEIEHMKVKDDAQDIAKMMGFSGFGKFTKKDENESSNKQQDNSVATKSAKTFDLDKLVDESCKNARKMFANQPKEDGDDELKEQLQDQTDNCNQLNLIRNLITDKSDLRSKDEAQANESESNSDNDDSEAEEDESDRYKNIPCESKIELTHGTKMLSAIAIDSDGSRFFTGGIDYTVKIWDFNKMQPGQMEDLRSFEPCGCHPIKRLAFSNSGQHVIIVSGSSQAKIVDRDGQNVVECPRGDPYLRDMNRTKGHVAMLNDGCWSPRDPSQFLTCAGDGTVRIWSVETAASGQRTVLKVRSKSGLRAIPTAVNLSNDLNYLIAGSDDGSISAWDHRRQRYVNNSFCLRDAHQPGHEITCVCFSHCGNQLASRSMDGSLALWDIRNRKLIKKYDQLLNRYSNTDCAFSPDDRYLCTGVAADKNDVEGQLVSFDVRTLSDQMAHSIKFGKASVLRVEWHSRINQLLIGTSDGKLHVYYDEKSSSAGALSSTRLKIRRGDTYKTDKAFMCSKPTVLTPHALPLFKTTKKRPKVVQELKDRLDPIKSKRPELPVGAHGQGGRIASSGSTYAQFIARNLAMKDVHPDDRMNPREALLRHAEEAEKNPYWVAPAYQKTQPKPIFQNNQTNNDNDDDQPPTKIAK